MRGSVLLKDSVLLKTEFVHHRYYATRAEATDIFAYIEGFYNRTRRHSAIGFISPIEMELKKQLNSVHFFGGRSVQITLPDLIV